MGASSKVHTLYDASLRNAPAKLRTIADNIEGGRYGEVDGVAVVLTSGSWLAVFGVGEQSHKAATVERLLEGIVHLKRNC